MLPVADFVSEDMLTACSLFENVLKEMFDSFCMQSSRYIVGQCFMLTRNPLSAAVFMQRSDRDSVHHITVPDVMSTLS